jgi:hypothetical protein
LTDMVFVYSYLYSIVKSICSWLLVWPSYLQRLHACNNECLLNWL